MEIYPTIFVFDLITIKKDLDTITSILHQTFELPPFKRDYDSTFGKIADTLKKYGAVSKDVVHEMWTGLLKETEADYGIAVSGIAGPTGGTTEKPVGTVFYALGKKGEKPEINTLHVKGNRQTVILRTTKKLFGFLLKKIL